MAAILEPTERITSVRIEGLALLKIVKHCHESLPQMVTGSLLGIEGDNGVLEITHAFPFPEPVKSSGFVVMKDDADEDADNAAGLEGHEFQLEMMRMLREVNVDNNCVGWYQSMYLGSYSTSSLLESQLSYQTDLSPNAVVVLYDPMQTSHGNLMIKCLRLTEECVRLRKSGKNSYLDPNSIFEQVPVEFSNVGLVRALLADLTPTKVDTSLDRLDLSTNPYLEKNLEFLCSWVDDLASEQLKFQYYTRNARGSGGQRRKKEETPQKWNSSEAPKRMESLLISNQIRIYCDQVNQFSEGGFGKLFLAGGLHQDEEKAANNAK